MKRVIRANDELQLTSRQLQKGKELLKLYEQIFDIIDDPEFEEDGEFFPLINDSKIVDTISEELHYLGNVVDSAR